MKSGIAAFSLACVSFLAGASDTRAVDFLSIAYKDGLLTIRCTNVSLGQVFEQIKSATGMELILEDPIKNTRLTADIQAQPVNLAIERLLEGSGVNYAMFFDRADWRRVARMFIGKGGGGGGSAGASAAGSRPAPVSRAPVRRVPEPAMVDDEPAEPEPDDEQDPGVQRVDEQAEESDQELSEEAAPQAPPAPNFLPPTPLFPRSSFTPGLESSPFHNPGSSGSGGSAAPSSGAGAAAPGSNPPPAYFPFLDPTGRPIPVPPGSMVPVPPVPQKQEKPKPQEPQPQ